MDTNKTKKLSLVVNTSILIIVIFMMGFFYMCKAKFLVYFSIPTICVYLIGYFILYKEKFYFYVMLVYSWIILYMSVTTVCLGYKYGFHLYTLSMIPIIYYVNYIAYKLGTKKVNASLISIAIVVCYLACMFYVLIKGPIYKENGILETISCTINSISVFSFLILYTKTIIKDIILSEEKLKEMSYVDRLTGLFNRHYMMERLKEAMGFDDAEFVAIIDIDDFKQINDEYGHNAGDYVLKKVSKIMKETCKDVIISRWGGEEFLLLMQNKEDYYGMMEDLRAAIAEEDYEFEGDDIKVTVTIGLAERKGCKHINKWVQAADNKLYEGKNSGKNVVVA